VREIGGDNGALRALLAFPNNANRLTRTEKLVAWSIFGIAVYACFDMLALVFAWNNITPFGPHFSSYVPENEFGPTFGIFALASFTGEIIGQYLSRLTFTIVLLMIRHALIEQLERVKEILAAHFSQPSPLNKESKLEIKEELESLSGTVKELNESPFIKWISLHMICNCCLVMLLVIDLVREDETTQNMYLSPRFYLLAWLFGVLLALSLLPFYFVYKIAYAYELLPAFIAQLPHHSEDTTYVLFLMELVKSYSYTIYIFVGEVELTQVTFALTAAVSIGSWILNLVV
jgi:hypothetical protein